MEQNTLKTFRLSLIVRSGSTNLTKDFQFEAYKMVISDGCFVFYDKLDRRIAVYSIDLAVITSISYKDEQSR